MRRFLNSSAQFPDVTTYQTDDCQVKTDTVTDWDRQRLEACAGLVPAAVESLLDVGTKTGYFCRLLQERGVCAHVGF